MKTGIILLAAGSSSRLGKPKQLIKIEGKTLIQRAIEEVQMSMAGELVVVLGWNPKLIQAGIQSENIPIVINENWEQGMASSMQAGLRYFQKQSQLDQVILMLCDQPFVSSSLLDQLIELRGKSDKGIVACSYSNTLGVPALFDQRYFPEMLELNGSDGAKKVILKNKEDVVVWDFPEGAIDLDTEEDLGKVRILLGG